MGMIYIGVDPGKKGAYATIVENGDLKGVYVYPWDDVFFVEHLKSLSGIGQMKACVEKVGAMPGQGVTSMFTFGKSAGYIEGVLSALGIPYQLVPPNVWKKNFGLGSDKQKSIEVARKLFPDVDLKRTSRCRNESDGLAEALLMAEYARRKL